MIEVLGTMLLPFAESPATGLYVVPSTVSVYLPVVSAFSAATDAAKMTNEKKAGRSILSNNLSDVEKLERGRLFIAQWTDLEDMRVRAGWAPLKGVVSTIVFSTIVFLGKLGRNPLRMKVSTQSLSECIELISANKVACETPRHSRALIRWLY